MTPFEFLYFLGYAVKKRYALKNQKRLPHRVISIGNITLGGTGKTPAAMALARKAVMMGLQPCILTRGYKGKAEGPCFVSRGEGPLIDAYQAGDEAMLMAETLPGVPIVKGKNRYEAGMFAIAKLRSPVPGLQSQFLFILDDGFQHWALHRDKDILLIDGTNPFGNRKLFPFGPLREPLAAMERADIMVITNISPSQPSPLREESKEEGVHSREASVRSLTEEIRKYASATPLYFAKHRPTALVTTSGNTFALSDMKHKKIFGFCGIGNPDSFKKTLLSLNAELKGRMIFRDHYQYRMSDFLRITDNANKCGADWIVTTEKDIMRLKGFILPDNLLALRIEFHVDEKFYEEVFQDMGSL
jgi:tetraacyldisaccharide 4'-kinase